MITGLLDLHSANRYLLVILLIMSLATAYYGLIRMRRYTEGVRKLHFVTRVLLNIQMLLGVALYILKGYYHTWANLSDLSGMVIFFAILHAAGMFAGISLINVGYERGLKAGTDRARYKNIAIFYSLGFLVIFLFIPWPFFHSWAMWF